VSLTTPHKLVDLRKPPIDINAAINGPAAAAMGGILGATLGETAGQAEARIAEAKKTATDLSGLVRKKAKADEPAAAPVATNGSSETTNGKRKADEVEDAPESEA
jgi:HAT1-interacting factor 1